MPWRERHAGAARGVAAFLGARLAHTSVGIGGHAWVGLGSREVRFCRRFLPFRARAYPALPTLFSLDKSGVGGRAQDLHDMRVQRARLPYRRSSTSRIGHTRPA